MALGLLAACTGGPDTEPASGTDGPTPSATDTETETEPGDAVDTDTEGVDTEDTAPEVIDDTTPTFDPAHGFFDAAFTLTLTTEIAGAALYYTTDGSLPAPDNGTLYTVPLTLETTTVVRAATYVDGALFQDLGSQTYLFPADVVNQSRPEGWPEAWWFSDDDGPYTADYEMDPEVYEDDTDSSGHFPDLFTEIPVVSLVMDPHDLFDTETGIHENPRERGEEWERAVWTEWLEADGTSATHYSGVRIHGGAGRRPAQSTKKSFRLAYRAVYDGDFEYPLYPESEVTEFDTLVLRAGYNRTWVHYSDTQRNRAQYVRERFTTQSHAAMGYLAVNTRYVHLFLNGMYWGVYLAQERPDAHFMASHVGGDAADYDALNSGEASDGDLTYWDQMFDLVREDLSVADNYDALSQVIDPTSFADYMLLNLYFGNYDWPEKNWWSARERTDEAKWHFFIWDGEFMLGNWSEDVLDVSDEGTPGEIWQALRNNEEWVVLWGDRVQHHCYGDGVLTAEDNLARWDAVTDELLPALYGESARWGDHYRDVRETGDELYLISGQWTEEQTRLRESYFDKRTENFIETLREDGLFPSIDAPEPSSWSGTFTAGDTLTLYAPDGDVYCTTDGTDPRLEGGELSSAASECAASTIDETTTITARALLDDEWSAKLQITLTVP